MKRFIRSILLTLNLVLALAIVLAGVSTLINPKFVWFLSYFGLFYPHLLILNVVFILIWLLRFRKYFLISVIAILLGFNQFQNTFQLGLRKKESTPPKKTLSVLTYNVRLFDLYKWAKDPESRSQIFEWVKNADPDIVCFQEYMTNKKGSFSENEIKNKLNNYPYEFHHYNISYKMNIGLALYSKYPIINSGFIEFSETLNHVLYTDLLIGPDTIRVYNAHLQSVGFGTKNYKLLDSLKLEYDEQQLHELKDISILLRKAYIKRADQALKFKAHVNKCQYPVIVCGDFNDTPVSYTYRLIKEDMLDTFKEEGHGFGVTYKRGLSAFRIDYILHSKDIRTTEYKRTRIPYSDHFPVMATIAIR